MANVSWMSEPDGRGTFRLLAGCLTTLFLCVYTALHLNIFPKDTHRLRILYKKLQWVLMGMIAPELVVFTAWSQWMSARRLTELVNKHQDCNTHTKVKWTMTHSYYAQMGGFVFDTDDPGENSYVQGSPRLFLTANGVVVLAEMGHLPTLSREFIQDKSKADGLAKTLVIVQAGWLILQSIERAASNLPITCLELNTIAHVVCAFIMYFLWWDKPLDVQDPVVLSGEWTRPAAAVMWMFSRVSIEREYKSVLIKPPEIESLVHFEWEQMTVPPSTTSVQEEQSGGDVVIDMGTNRDTTAGSYRQQLSYTPSRTGNNAQVDMDDLIVVRMNLPYGLLPVRRILPLQGLNLDITSDQVLLPFGFGPKRSSRHFQRRNVSRSKIPHYYTSPVRTSLDMTTLTRWHLAYQCLKKYPEIWNRYKRQMASGSKYDNENQRWLLSEYPDTLCRDVFVDVRIPNWPSKHLIRKTNPYYSVLFFSICVMVYGGLHEAAWKDYFPTNFERIFWRCSALYIACSGLIYWFVKVLDAVFGWIADAFRSTQSNERGVVFGCLRLIWLTICSFVSLILAYALFGLFLAYVLTRSFIVVEAFISLRSQPAAMYQTPRWTQYLSHL